MTRVLGLSLLLAGCTSQSLGAPITCGDVKLSTDTGSCAFDTQSPCSDGKFYTIDCQDDSTCSCTMNGSLVTSIIAGDSTTFCAGVDDSKLHELAADCGWNINP